MLTSGARTQGPRLVRHRRALSWAVPRGWVALSSASVGGGLTRPGWVLNAGVDGSFDRTDLPAWAAETAAALGLVGEGCALLTAADVTRVEHAARGGVDAWATVGVTRPTWPHDPRAGGTAPTDTAPAAAEAPPEPGTVNIVLTLPVALTPSALVQALGTVTEAKAQVLVQAGVPGTGTASDAVVVLCPGEGDAAAGDVAVTAPVAFAGVRSVWGRRVAHAVHDAVRAGLEAHPFAPAPGEERVW